MNKYIRWQGLLTFVGFFAVLFLLVYLFAAPLMRWGLTTGLTRVNGAEVNIDKLDLRWSPFALELQKVQFTDPETPELNRFQADRVAFEMQLLQAMIGRIYIDELNADGIVMGVERESRGKVRADYIAEREAEGDTPTWGERFAELGFEFPDVDELLERSEIRTPEVIETTSTRSRESRDNVEGSRDQLPDSERIESYEERLDALREARPRSIEEFEELRQTLSELRDDMRTDRDAVREFKNSVESAYQQVSEDVQRLRDAPSADIDRVRRLIAMDDEAISDMAGILFGPQVQRWTDYALVAYDFVAPMLQREAEDKPTRWEGRHIDFDRGNRPVFLIALATTSMRIGEVDLALRWDNITWQHERIGSPTTYRLELSESPYWQSLNADGNFFINEAIEFSGQQQWALQGAQLSAQTLLEQRDIRIDMAEAMINSRGDIRIENGRFSGGGNADLSAVDLSTEGERSWTAMLGSALQQINAFDLDIGLEGRIGSPRLRIDSDLDNQLSSALSGVVQEYASSQLADVQARLQGQVDEALGDIQPRLEQIQQLRSLAEERESTLQGMLDEELDNLRDSARDELENRLRDVIRGRLGGG
ncbi:TIGR03545 family protein [Aliidiomarina soli]|uniref:TIGR03545 family protein n=1 Tax=Aliidiomarina soli TaxID=1928574 RepID=A0A432WE89_9GAMM|nr:TIGR03545 family protein [Aliidiomarina soli]RUO31186.1 hypothetical protein CWE14_11870 [Aliidiomarina soli]